MSLPRILILLLACLPLRSVAQERFKGKVAYVKQTTYLVLADTVPLERNPVTTERTRKLNENQQLLTDKAIHFKVAGVSDAKWIAEEIRTYNKKGQLVKRKASDTSMHSRSTWTYDDSGRVIETEGDAKYGDSASSWQQYVYYEAGKKKQVKNYYPDNKRIASSVAYFNAGGKWDSMVCFGSDNKVYCRTLVAYDAAGNEVERSLANEKAVTSRWTYRYNEKGQKVEENSLRGHVIYKYDDKGNEIEAVVYDDKGRFHDAVTKTYNDKGYLIKVVTDNRDQLPVNTYYQEDDYADFDEAGNYLKATEHHIRKHKDQTFVTVYEIRYHD